MDKSCARWVWIISTRPRDLIENTNWPQLLRHSELAATKLKQLKDRLIDEISEALGYKCTALGFLGRHGEQLECAKEWYCLWNTKPTDLGAIDAAFGLIGSCINNKEYADAHLYASTLYEIINHKHDNKIPEDERQWYIAKGAYFLADAKLRLARNESIPPGEMKKAGQEAITLARKALEIHTQVYRTENERVANDMGVLAEALDFFNDDGDDEVLRLYERTRNIYSRVYGASSVNVALAESKIGTAYISRATKALDANDHDHGKENLNLALSSFLSAGEIFRSVGHTEKAHLAAQRVEEVEGYLRQIATSRTAGVSKG